MADKNRDLTGVPIDDLSAEEAAVASEQLMAKISELIAQMQRSELRRGSLANENESIQSAGGFKGYLARLLNAKASEREVHKQEDLGLSIREMKKMQAMMLHKSIVEFRSNPGKETEDAAKARYADLELQALRSLGDIYREGIIDKNAYAKVFNDIDEQSNRVYRGGAQNLNASREAVEEDRQAESDAAAKSSIFNRAKEFGASIGSSIGNSRFGKIVGGMARVAYPFYQKNKGPLGKIFNGQVGAKGASSALYGAADLVNDPRLKFALMAVGKITEWAGEYSDDRAEKRQMGIAGGFGIGALGTEKAQQYEDIGESLNKGGGKAFASFAANVNNMLEQMRRGGDGGQLAAANQRYGLVLNGSGEGGLAKDADEVIRNIISKVSTYQKSGNVQAIAGLFRTLGIDQKNMELFMHGQAAYDARVKSKAKMLDWHQAEKLDEVAMKGAESDFEAKKSARIRNESWARAGGAISRRWNTLKKGANALVTAPAGISGIHREAGDEVINLRDYHAENAIESERAQNPKAFGDHSSDYVPLALRQLPFYSNPGSEPRVIPSTVSGGANGGGVRQENSLTVKVDKVDFHTTSSTLEGAGQDIGRGIKDGLESWSKPLVKNFGDTEL